MSIYGFLRSLILPLREIDNFLPPKGKIVDLGCGQGLIAKYLAREKKRLVTGIDLDRSRLPKSSIQNLKFIYGDIKKFQPKNVSGVVLSDVLHHLFFSDQRKLLTRIASGIKKGGILIIKEIDTKEFLRSKFSRFWDFTLYPKDRIYYWDSKELENSLLELGFKVKIIRPCRFFPGSTTLFICKK